MVSATLNNCDLGLQAFLTGLWPVHFILGKHMNCRWSRPVEMVVSSAMEVTKLVAKEQQKHFKEGEKKVLTNSDYRKKISFFLRAEAKKLVGMFLVEMLSCINV